MRIQFIHLCLIIFYSYPTHRIGIFLKCEKSDQVTFRTRVDRLTFRILNHYATPKLKRCGVEYIIIICTADGGGGGEGAALL